MFDVSPKTIRDIWSRRTWKRATCHLWEEEGVYVQLEPHQQARQRKTRKVVEAYPKIFRIIDEIHS
jgi:hypothetical protein